MTTDEASILVEASQEFARNLKRLKKKYAAIRSDIEPILEQLELGEVIGNQITGTGYNVYKVRINNSDIQKGKSGGYRVIYYLKTPVNIILVTIFSKSEYADIPKNRIVEIIREFLQYGS